MALVLWALLSVAGSVTLWRPHFAGCCHVTQQTDPHCHLCGLALPQVTPAPTRLVQVLREALITDLRY